MSGASPVEVEATLAFTGEGRSAAWDAIAAREELAGYGRTAPRRLELHDRYFDLPSGALRAAGVALRWRLEESDAGVASRFALKGRARRSPGEASVTRLELEEEWSPSLLARLLAELPALGVETPPSPSAEASTPEEALAAAGLRPIQGRRTRRRVAELKEGATGVAELALDHVLFEARGRRVEHRELEIESTGSGGHECLERVAAELLAEHRQALRVWTWSKSALGCELERLADDGALASLLEKGELTPAGYDAIDARLRSRA